MAPEVIDLISSDEEDGSPDKAARDALRAFKSGKQKRNGVDRDKQQENARTAGDWEVRRAAGREAARARHSTDTAVNRGAKAATLVAGGRGGSGGSDAPAVQSPSRRPESPGGLAPESAASSKSELPSFTAAGGKTLQQHLREAWAKRNGREGGPGALRHRSIGSRDNAGLKEASDGAVADGQGASRHQNSPQASRIEAIRTYQEIEGGRRVAKTSPIPLPQEAPVVMGERVDDPPHSPDEKSTETTKAPAPRSSEIPVQPVKAGSDTGRKNESLPVGHDRIPEPACIQDGAEARSDSESLDEIPARPSKKRKLSQPSFKPRSEKTQQLGEAKPMTEQEVELSTETFRRGATTQAPVPPKLPEPSKNTSDVSTRFGAAWSREEDLLLKKLKEVDQIAWSKMPAYFSGRTSASIQFRYSSKLKGRQLGEEPGPSKSKPVHHKAGERQLPDPPKQKFKPQPQPQPVPMPMPDEAQGEGGRTQRKRAPKKAPEGFVPWASVRAKPKQEIETLEGVSDSDARTTRGGRQNPARTRPSLGSILRRRELGEPCSRYRSTKATTTDLQNHVLGSLGPNKYYIGTSGDVNSTAWSADGSRFAIGSIGVSDERSMQYNRPRNLLYGDLEENVVRELPEHHLPRPEVGLDNPNSLHAMKQTQDPRLFMTVSNVAFVDDTLYTAGSDARIRSYSPAGQVQQTTKYEAAVDLLATNSNHLVAAGCHTGVGNSIVVHDCKDGIPKLLDAMAPSHSHQSQAIFPSAMKWGSAHRHQHLLLAGFGSDSLEEHGTAGATRLWDFLNGIEVGINAVTRNVFDVAWNPQCSPASTAFAIACLPSHGISSRHSRSVIQCFAPGQTATRVVEYDCPALDINDLLYCPYDDNLIAAGATDSKVYIWDKRFANLNQRPLHILSHGASVNVLDHDREVEAADTGIRFLSWGANSSRLFSGSSDGTVKVWDPYRSAEDAHVEDVVTLQSAVMSGSFSPDFRDLLVGEERGRVNLLSVGCESQSMRAMSIFDLQSAPAPFAKDPLSPARQLHESNQVKFAPMGDLPKRQAVQGDDYRGPNINTRAERIKAAEKSLSEALESNGENSAEKNLKIEEAMEKKDALERQFQDYLQLEPKARAQQKAFVGREQTQSNRLGFLDPCRLDCNYLPQDVGEAVNDSRRSEQRIPDALVTLKREVHPSVLDHEDPEDLLAAGLLSKCAKCTKPAPRATKGLPQCSACARKAAGRTASCAKCRVAIVPSGEGASGLCEHCSSACFRCGQPVRITAKAWTIICEPCALAWEVGVLGYDIIDEDGSLARKKKKNGAKEGLMPGLEDEDELVGTQELGAREREHYASLWGT
ncbi:hypothetical protein MBLNU230_g5768t1 [Neophaeotheca triangularis]